MNRSFINNIFIFIPASISGSFDHYLTNDNLGETYEKLKNIIDENMNDKVT